MPAATTAAAQNYWSAKSAQSNIALQGQQGFQAASQSDKNQADAQLANAQRLQIEGTTPLAVQQIQQARESIKKTTQEIIQIKQNVLWWAVLDILSWNAICAADDAAVCALASV